MRLNTLPALIFGVALLPVLASAQEYISFEQTHPSTLDQVVLVVETGCGYAANLDELTVETEQADLENAEYSHRLIVPYTISECQITAPPPTFHRISLGKLPKGRHHFRTSVWLTGYDGLSVESDVDVVVEDAAGFTVSGAWYAPEQSGRGIFILRMPKSTYEDDQHTPPPVALYWATHDSDGNATWALTSGAMTDNIVSGTAVTTSGTPLAPGPADLPQSEWGTLSFEYLGCGKGHLTWDANDPSITDGSIDIVQLVRPAESSRQAEVCNDQPAELDATWIEE